MKKNRFFLLMLVMVFCLLLAVPENGSISLLKQKSVPDFVVEIVLTDGDKAVRKAAGSGVIYDIAEDKLRVVTAAHILDNRAKGDEIAVCFTGDEAAVCQNVTTAEDADIAFLELGIEELSAETLKRLCAAQADQESFDSLAQGALVRARGYRDGSIVTYEGSLEEFWIYVEDFAQYMMVAECDIYQGMSGGALCDEEGNLIGILCGGSEQGELVAVPWHVVQAKIIE